MRTKLVNTAAGVIHRALQRCETSAGIAIALDSAGLLMSPETAAELAVLREDIATADDDVLAAQRHNDATCEAAQALDRVRAVHERIGGAGDDAFCYVCSNHGDIEWPCRTVAAIAPPASRCVLHGSSCDGDLEQAHIMQPAVPEPVCPVCQRPGCCCSCFGKSPRPDCTHAAPKAGER